MGLFDRPFRTLQEDAQEYAEAVAPRGVADDDYIVMANEPEPVPRPCGNRVIIRPIAEDEFTPGGLIKPEVAKEKPTKGTVLAVGEELGPQPLDPSKPQDVAQVFRAAKLSVDDVVLYGKYAGMEFEHEGEKLLIVRYDDILAVYQPKPEYEIVGG